MSLLDISIPRRADRRRRELGELKVEAYATTPKYHKGPERVVKVTAAMGRKTKSRFMSMPLSGVPAKMPPFDSPAVVEGRTIYPSTVKDPAAGGLVLKSGKLQSKIGGQVLKGAWKGMPIYALTLEERATCPIECVLWRACYGNHMHLALRYRHGPELEEALRAELAVLARRHLLGFVIRLHALGDFYSETYVQFWRSMLALYPGLRIFGYSARWRAEDPVAVALIKLAMDDWSRFAIRFSNAPVDTCSTITIEHAAQKPADAIICPEQLGKTESCSTCALCWSTEKRIAFIRH